MLRGRMAFLRLGMLAMLLAAAAGARLEVTRQPVGNARKGFLLEQQPRIRVVLEAVDEILPAGAGTVNSIGGAVRAPMDRAGQSAGSTDVTIFNTVNVTFGTNPVGATFAGGVYEFQVDMSQGAVDFTDIQITTGGSGFTLRFSVLDARGDVLTVESDPFDCGGQEARLEIVQQPVLILEGSTASATPPIIHVVDSYSKRLELANPVITASMFYNPGNAGFGSSSAAVRASEGIAVMDGLRITKAATEVESDLPKHLLDTKSTKYRLRFSSPGFTDIISDDFETLPVLSIKDQPVSDHTRIVTATCSGNSSGCVLFVQDYLNKTADGAVSDQLQTASLHVDIACTDLDGPDEFVTSVSVGNRKLQPGLQFQTGPWADCGFAGCRDQCDTNMRRVVSGLNVKDDIGNYDKVTTLYKSMGAPLRVHVGITDKVNICPCDGQPLKIKVQLHVTYSQAPAEQGTPMQQQPRVLLLNADGTLYTLRQKYVMVTYATEGADPFDALTAFGNPSGAQLSGNTQVLSKNGEALFTDLAVTEGGKGYVLRFHVRGVYNVNSTSVIDSKPFNVGCGSFPQLTLDCVDCSRPAPSRQEARSLSQPPQLELLRTLPGGSRVKSASFLQVHMSFGTNGPAGMFSRDSRTVRNADEGSVKFADVTIYNGNCAFCPNRVCGEGYTLYFIANDVALESQEFDIAGGNRSPKFIHPSPAAGSSFVGVMAVPRKIFTLNLTDDNHDEMLLSLTSDQGSSVSCQPGTCMTELNGAILWGNEVEFVPQAEDDECSRPLFAGNGPSYPPDGLYWGMYADMTFAPTCEQASSTYPPMLGQTRTVEDLCFMPSDKVTRVDPPITTNGEERCYQVGVMTPAAPYFTQPFKKNHTQAGIEDIAEPSAEEMEMIAAKASMLEYPSPPLMSYLPPHAAGDDVEKAGLGGDFRSLYVGVGCRLVVPLAVAEVQAQVMSDGAVQTQLRVQALRTTRSSLYEQRQLAHLLPDGARIVQGPLANPHVSSFEWEPQRGQEGYVYTVCFEIVTEFNTGCSQRFYTAPYHGHPSQYCLDVHVERCKYCMRSGESLEGLARSFRTTVPQLWAGNPSLLQPDLLSIGTLLHLGIVYTADVDDRLPKLAQQVGRTVEEVLRWNPDLPLEDVKLLSGDDVLISSATRYDHRKAPWAVRNGTFVADSQTVCLLPNICLHTPIPEGEVSVETSSFDCGMCEAGSEFCTGAICVMGEVCRLCLHCMSRMHLSVLTQDGARDMICGEFSCGNATDDALRQGSGPWAREKCTRYLGSRCERCEVCRAEQFDLEGHLAVAGTWRSRGCDGLAPLTGLSAAMAEEDTYVTCHDCTPDSTCTPCTVCSDGQIEKAPCTLTSDRVCIEAGATMGQDDKIVPPPGYSGVFLPPPK